MNRFLVTSVRNLGESEIIVNAIASGILVLVLILSRAVIVRVVRQSKLPADQRLQWLVRLRNAAILTLLLGLTIVWAEELRAVAVSIVAIAAALAISLKEIILCLTGAIVRSASGMFSLGDRIEVGGHRGDVVDIGPFATTLLEVGPGQQSHQLTGRSVVIPNSTFLVQPVLNESFTDHYVLHFATIPVPTGKDWARTEAALLLAAQEECAAFLDDATEHIRSVAERQGIDAVSAAPRVNVRIGDDGRVSLVLRFPAPARQRGLVEQAILRQVLRQLAMEEPPQKGEVSVPAASPTA